MMVLVSGRDTISSETRAKVSPKNQWTRSTIQVFIRVAKRFADPGGYRDAWRPNLQSGTTPSCTVGRSDTRMNPKELGALILLGALWGGSFLFIRIAVPALGPFVLMDLRVGLAAVALALYALAIVRLPELRSRWRQFLTIGALN